MPRKYNRYPSRTNRPGVIAGAFLVTALALSGCGEDSKAEQHYDILDTATAMLNNDIGSNHHLQVVFGAEASIQSKSDQGETHGHTITNPIVDVLELNGEEVPVVAERTVGSDAGEGSLVQVYTPDEHTQILFDVDGGGPTAPVSFSVDALTQALSSTDTVPLEPSPGLSIGDNSYFIVDTVALAQNKTPLPSGVLETTHIAQSSYQG